MGLLPYRQLAGFYFFYFAYIGAFAPFFSVYLAETGLSPVEIGVVMALPQVTRIIAPHLWGWLADAGGNRMRVVRLTTLVAASGWLGMFAGSGFLWICAIIFTVCFFFSAALPLMEAATLTHIGEHTGRYGNIRLWGSLGYIAAVIAVGYALDFLAVSALLWIVLVCILGTLAFAWIVPEAASPAHASDEQPIMDILRRPAVIALISACALMAVAHGPYYTFYSIHLVDHGYSKGVAGWLWALGVICEIAIFLWLPRLYAAYSLRSILIASFALSVVRFLVIGWGADSLVLLLFAQVLHAASFGSFHAAAIGIVHQLFRGRHQARGQAIYGSLTFGIGGTVGSLASGYAWQPLGAALTFSAASACALAGMLLVAWKVHVRERER
ncbi:MAG TPA: MFS transporter [Burkholderiales bacterium]|jgi:PPP family 3-phenylpropionic acid transporter|nr:MFS transporter [Burkholderiales bacterium]